MSTYIFVRVRESPQKQARQSDDACRVTAMTSGRAGCGCRFAGAEKIGIRQECERRGD